MAKQPAADVVVIGLGAAGGIAAHVLSEAGAEVVVLEAGPRLDRRRQNFDEIGNDIRESLARPKALGEVPTWRHSSIEEARRAPWPIIMANGVGGSSVHYEAMSLRFLPWNFATRTGIVMRYGPGALPAGSSVADWPVTYDELEQYYDKVEYSIGVSGRSGRTNGRLDERGNYFEGFRSRGYPMPPLRESGWASLMASTAQRLGWHPFPTPAAINSVPYDGRPQCTYCGFCRNNACYCDAKGSTAATVIPRAETSGHLRVLTSARAISIEIDDDGLASGARFVKDGREHVQPGSTVLLGGFTYENVRLLLLSKSKQFPLGLSNNRGQVGKHFMAHVTPFAARVFRGKRLNLFNGTVAQGVCLDDWNADNFDHTGLGFVGGGMLTAGGELKPIATACAALPPGVPRWGAAWKAWLRQNAQSLALVFAQFDSLPYEDAYLDLDETTFDPYGLPVVRVTHALRENEQRGGAFLAERLKTWLLAAGADQVFSDETFIVDARHAYGGTRMGSDPDVSVVDGFGFSHEVPNLGVIGASTFPTAGGHNPTLTVQALAWRTAEQLVAEWKAIAR